LWAAPYLRLSIGHHTVAIATAVEMYWPILIHFWNYYEKLSLFVYDLYIALYQSHEQLVSCYKFELMTIKCTSFDSVPIFASLHASWLVCCWPRKFVYYVQRYVSKKLARWLEGELGHKLLRVEDKGSLKRLIFYFIQNIKSLDGLSLP